MIKRNFKKFLLLCVVTAFVSCNSEEITLDDSLVNANSVSSKSVNSPILLNFTLLNEENVQLLSFETWEDFQAFSENLDTIVEQYDDAFLNTHSELSNEALEELEEISNYTDQQPLIDFENSIGFTQALRKRFNTEMNLMLETDDLNPALDPNINLDFSGGELSLVNNHQEIKIADTIYVFKDGLIGKIFGNIETNLLSVRTSAITDAPGMAVYTPNSGGSSCYARRASDQNDQYASKNKVRLVAKIRSIPAWAKGEKMTVHYKKKNNGKWKESRTKMAVNIGAYFYENCSSTVYAAKPRNTFKKKKRRDIKVNEWTPLGILKTKKGGIWGTHFYSGKEVFYALE